MKKIQVLIRELDEFGKVINDRVISEIESIAIDLDSESGKMEWLGKVEQNALDVASTLKKNLQSNKSNTKKKK